MNEIISSVIIFDSRIVNLQNIILLLKDDIKYIVLDYFEDTSASILSKLSDLKLKNINNIGLIRHGYILETYKLYDKQNKSILYNVKTNDPGLSTWSVIKNFLFNIISMYNIKNFDFISCNLEKSNDYLWVFEKLKSRLGINIRGLKGSDKNITDLYFSKEILVYPNLFYEPVVTVTVNLYKKEYDGVLFNNPTVTYNGFENNNELLTLSGKLIFTGTFSDAINIGKYTINVNGQTSNKYFLDYKKGILEIIKRPLIISINNIIKIYDGTNIMNNYDISYSNIIKSDSNNIKSKSIKISNNISNAINVDIYKIIPSRINLDNYEITYNNSILQIIPKKLIIKANNISKIFDNDPFFGGNNIKYNGFVNNENITNLEGEIIFSGNSQGAINPGIYKINIDGLSSNNYCIEYVPGILTIYDHNCLKLDNNFLKFYENLFISNKKIEY